MKPLVQNAIVDPDVLRTRYVLKSNLITRQEKGSGGKEQPVLFATFNIVEFNLPLAPADSN